jgi:hypothetical protein
MKCSKCGQENLKSIEFCVRCHYPLRFTCPSCKHEQPHGGTCDKCGADFAKFAAMMLYQAQLQAEQSREAKKNRHGMLKEVLLAIFTGGLSILLAMNARHKDE